MSDNQITTVSLKFFKPHLVWINIVSALLVFCGVALLTWQILFPWVGSVLGIGSVEKVYKPIPENWDAVEQTVPSFIVNTLNQSLLGSLGTREVPVEFYLTIESLGIEHARVITNVNVSKKNEYLSELKKGVGHLLGSAYPGEWGNSILFGHSVSTVFYDPADYARIFSILPTITIGDTFEVEFEGKKFVYKVDEKRIVDPNASPAEFAVNPGRRMTLITCVPPGLTTKRLLVIGHLVE